MRRLRRSRGGIAHRLAPLLVALVSAASTAAAADEPVLDLLAAMQRARQSAPAVRAAAARFEAAAAREREARGYRLPRLGLSEVWTRTDSPAEAFALLLNQERFSFPDFAASDPNDPDPIESATTRLEVSLPVYTGGELSGRIDQAARAAAAAGEVSRRAADDAAFAAAEAWVRLAQAREQTALLERSLATVEAHVALARAYVDQGMLVTSELLRAEVERARIADFVAEARGQARVAEAALSFRLAADQASHWRLGELPPPAAPGEELDAWLAAAAARPDLAAARELTAIAALEVDVRRAARRPRLGLVGRYDLTDEDLFGAHGEAASVMAAATFDLFAGGRHRAALAAGEQEAAAAAADLERFADGVLLEVRQAWEAQATARDRHATAGAALAAAAEAERITEERFRQGIVKTIDLLDAATARREAETRELVARAEAHLAVLRLALAAGRAPESAAGAFTTPAATEEASTP